MATVSSTVSPSFRIRRAVVSDVPAIYSFIVSLADFEHATHEVENSIERLTADGFGPEPRFIAFIMEEPQEGSADLFVPIGHAICYFTYSTWKGLTFYLDDLFVRPDRRSRGVGLAALKKVVEFAQEQGCKRVQWQALDWNTEAIRFYESQGAVILREWLNLRLDEAAMAKFLGKDKQQTK